jgi:hypothetical protein
MRRGRKMGTKHNGGHHRGGHSLPEDTHDVLTVRKEDAEAIRQMAYNHKWKIMDTVHWMIERIKNDTEN